VGEDVDRRFANALPQIVWTVAADGTQEWINDRWTELTGIPPHEANNATSMAAIHADDRLKVQTLWDAAVETETPAELEYRIRTRAGTYRWHLARIAPMYDERGVLARWVGVSFDMQDRREAEEALRASERRFEQLFMVNPQPMAIVREKDAVFAQVNDAFLELTGFAREAVVEKDVISLGMLSTEQRHVFGPSPSSCARRQLEVPLRIEGGKTLTVMLTTTRIELAGEPCLLGVAQDITEQRATEAALRHSEARARARADELSVLMDALPAAVWIAHDSECSDVRGNRAANELLRLLPNTNVSKTGNPDGTKHLTVLHDGLELAGDDLPVHRAARGIEVRDVEKEIRFDDGRSTFLYGSAVPLRDPSGAPRGAIGAFVDVTHLKHAQAVMREADRRKDEFLARLSHELRNPLAPILTAAQLMELRGDAVAVHEREVILRQARRLVRLVDEMLDVSKVTRGVASLATAKTTRVIAHATPAPRSRLSPKRILVVDDNQDAGLMLSRVLEGLGHTVRVATDPTEALAAALSFQPEVAILDIGLPVMDGYALGRELRRRLATPPRLLALTGYGLAQDRRRSHEAGFVSHLVKPLDVAVLLAALEDLAVTSPE
jgi:PAS domain S-box-containing protein